MYKFIERQVAVKGDIERMFLQIVVDELDQDALLCLWRYSDSEPISMSRMTVMTFGTACSPSIAQYVKNLNANKFEYEFPVVDAITQ